MAITLAGTVVKVPSKDIPSGFVQPVVTTFTDGSWLEDKTISVTKSTVEDATQLTTFSNIITDIETQVTAILTNDYIGTNTVDAYIVFNSLTSNIDTNNKTGSEFYTNVAATYECFCKVFVKVS